jgi:hypothetical protein
MRWCCGLPAAAEQLLQRGVMHAAAMFTCCYQHARITFRPLESKHRVGRVTVRRLRVSFAPASSPHLGRCEGQKVTRVGTGGNSQSRHNI